jgi:hypothetical protein
MHAILCQIRTTSVPLPTKLQQSSLLLSALLVLVLVVLVLVLVLLPVPSMLLLGLPAPPALLLGLEADRAAAAAITKCGLLSQLPSSRTASVL